MLGWVTDSVMLIQPKLGTRKCSGMWDDMFYWPHHPSSAILVKKKSGASTAYQTGSKGLKREFLFYILWYFSGHCFTKMGISVSYIIILAFVSCAVFFNWPLLIYQYIWDLVNPDKTGYQISWDVKTVSTMFTKHPLLLKYPIFLMTWRVHLLTWHSVCVLSYKSN